MKYFLSVLSLLTFLFAAAQSDPTILFVDDSDDTFGNAETFSNAISSLGYSLILHDAVADGSPTIQQLEPFDIVIWYTSSDGTALNLWNGNETDNVDLVAYLESGGVLWLVGLDFLFDRYGSAPADFAQGDFVFDFLGLSSYEVQSYGDDGGIGVSEFYPSPQSPIGANLSLTFIFETMWWVDGVTLVENAEPVYEMGGSGYVLEGEVCGLYYESETSKALTYLFDISLVDPVLLQPTIFASLNFLESELVSASHIEPAEFRVFPNPSTGNFSIDFSQSNQEIEHLRLVDLSGRTVWEDRKAGFNQNLSAETIQIELPEHLDSGMYCLQTISGNKTSSVKISLLDH